MMPDVNEKLLGGGCVHSMKGPVMARGGVKAPGRLKLKGRIV